MKRKNGHLLSKQSINLSIKSLQVIIDFPADMLVIMSRHKKKSYLLITKANELRKSRSKRTLRSDRKSSSMPVLLKFKAKKWIIHLFGRRL